jgi:A/G-specific adenine glycosylase
MIDLKHISNFGKALLAWHSQSNDRDLPWKKDQTAYHIWLSEIILQQTRVAQGLPYYMAFKTTFPTIFDLANAPLDQVLKLWQGLGYYARARNLHAASKQIVTEFGGVFPKKHTDLMQIKGIGDYTASAISSFAFDEPNAVLDGNVIRLLSRYFGIADPFDTSAGRKKFRDLAQNLLGKHPPAEYNQAIMDFGATICKPQVPLCNECPFSASCVAFKNELIGELPYKQKKLRIRSRYFYYLIVKRGNKLLINQRTGKDIWQGLWDFPMIEYEKTTSSIKKTLAISLSIDSKLIVAIDGPFLQLLSHQKIIAHFVEVKEGTYVPQENQIWVTRSQLKKLAVPKTIFSFLREKSYF